MQLRRDDSLYFRGVPPRAATTRDKDAVVVDQRARMLDAITTAVATKGYATATVADVVGAAGVSRRTFYEQFDDKEACFLAAYDEGASVLLADVAAAVRAADVDTWEDRVGVGLEAYCSVMADEPDLARTLMVDVLGAGPRAVELRRQVLSRFVGVYRALRDGARAEEPSLPHVPDVWLRALVGAIDSLVAEHILTDGAQSLRLLAPTLTELAVAVLAAGPRAQVEDTPSR